MEKFKLSEAKNLEVRWFVGKFVESVFWDLMNLCMLNSCFGAQQATRTPAATNAWGCSQEMRSLSTTVQPQHSARRTLELLQLWHWKRVSHQPPSDYHLFGSLKQHLGHCRFHNKWIRFRGPRCLRSGSTASGLLELRVRIPWGPWISVSCECCVLSEISATGRSLVHRSPTECGYVIECDQVQQNPLHLKWLGRKRSD